jgi:uncharacterized DUF497 family protein
VEITFDPSKDRLNQTKHGLSLALAEVLFAGTFYSVEDDRFDYGETRNIALGIIRGRVFVCVYTDRGTERRVISLRKANKREVQRYDQFNEQNSGSSIGGGGLE